jgi:ribose transport system ATP-binding protein
VAENIFLGREPRGRSGLIDYRRLNADAAAVLDRLELRVSPEALIADLRVGQQQLVEIARAVSADVRVLILDEPTSSLSSHEVEVLFRVIRELKARGVALIYITHKFEELARIGDDVTVMRDGRVVGDAPLAELSRDAIVRLMAGREPRELFQKSAPNIGGEILRAEAVYLPGEGVGRRFLVENVSLSLRRGEVLGIFGLVGAGRTELLETLFGLHARRATGSVLIDGRCDRRGPGLRPRGSQAGWRYPADDRRRQHEPRQPAPDLALGTRQCSAGNGVHPALSGSLSRENALA